MKTKLNRTTGLYEDVPEHAHNFKHIETITKHKPPIKTYIVMMCYCGTVMAKEVKFESD